MANEHKVTPWFPVNRKPSYTGWYETRLPGDGELFHSRRFWNGRCWSFARDAGLRSATQQWQWRGLASKPKESA